MKKALQVYEVYTFRKFSSTGKLLKTWRVRNLVVTQGLNDVNNKYFKGSAYTATWFIGIINSADFTALAAGDTAAKIVTSTPGVGDNQWKEFTGYSEATRPALVLGTSTGGVVDNSASAATFTITTGFSFKGAFLSSASGKGAITGILFGEAAGVVTAYVAAQVLSVTVQITVASA